ncbi:hypothetical protein K491DRAFT_588934 [Lophiostoma macrostomum CBS 122681]|uniref:DUF7820 domain-containing protein n=1 Tax=Lophiostoma macrostomum CBS 122681 TaxID=1314788 RepID=A0A6A6TPG5_9PLEO|nr:hypothetical protein K491DRAFT_588934 [Lophiostoma macrostomum CBS 122681]
MPAVSDGFRPSGLSRDERPQDLGQGHDRISPPRPALTNTKSAESDLRRLASRNSTVKTPYPREAISHDARNAGTHHARGPSSQATAALQHRASVSSTASFATMAHSDSALGAEPSHPYGMYPQNTMARSSSVATSSTQRQSRRSLSLQRPAHPYGMYPQNIVDDEPPIPPIQSAIPVGFPGLSTGYRRQIGPDGEEQDIIGPDGHTEQLPPYTRYPDEVPTKAALAADSNATTTPVDAPAIVPFAPSASGDALVSSPVSPITPPQSSLSEQRESNSRGSVAMGVVPIAPALSITSSTSTTSTEHGGSEKPIAEDKPKSWRSKKLWGKVPMGLAVVLLILVLVFAIVLGAAIGTFVSKNSRSGKNNGKNNHDDDAQPQVTGTDVFDATKIPIPTGLPPLPAGSFALPLGVAQESSPGCLPQANQLSAWSCKMTFAPLKLVIDNTTSNPDTLPHATLESFPSPDGTVPYGQQPPGVGDLNTEKLELVLDLDYPSYGPAWHFVAKYDKLVILRPEEFSAGSGLRKRDNGDDKPFTHRFQVAAGETPWYCYWNQTYIEAYIYVNQDSSAASMGPYPTSGSNSYAVTTMPTPTSNTPTLASSTSTTTTPAKRLRRRGDGDQSRLPPYPRIVKIEERRLPGAPQSYCQKMQVLDDLQVVSAVDNSGKPITFNLQEVDPSFADFYAAAGNGPPGPSPTGSSGSSRRGTISLARRKDPAGACHCQWMFQ